MATGRTRNGHNFPLTIALKEEKDDSLIEQAKIYCTDVLNYDPSNIRSLYQGVLWVFANISGLISFLPDGTIHNCNEYFIKTLLGYSKDELVGKDMTTIIPQFYDHLENGVDDNSMPLPPMDEEEEESVQSGATSTST